MNVFGIVERKKIRKTKIKNKSTVITMHSHVHERRNKILLMWKKERMMKTKKEKNSSKNPVFFQREHSLFINERECERERERERIYKHTLMNIH